jgi:hypothetical protein
MLPQRTLRDQVRELKHETTCPLYEEVASSVPASEPTEQQTSAGAQGRPPANLLRRWAAEAGINAVRRVTVVQIGVRGGSRNDDHPTAPGISAAQRLRKGQTYYRHTIRQLREVLVTGSSIKKRSVGTQAS